VKSNRRLRFTTDARTDLRDIRRYTADRWGARQRDVYDARLNRALSSLIEYPELGPPRDDLFPGCRNLVVGQHVIFYRLDGEVIVVGRVLHSSQDPVGKVTP
jgi:toxin ParE1/3/4